MLAGVAVTLAALSALVYIESLQGSPVPQGWIDQLLVGIYRLPYVYWACVAVFAIGWGSALGARCMHDLREARQKGEAGTPAPRSNRSNDPRDSVDAQ